MFAHPFRIAIHQILKWHCSVLQFVNTMNNSVTSCMQVSLEPFCMMEEILQSFDLRVTWVKSNPKRMLLCSESRYAIHYTTAAVPLLCKRKRKQGRNKQPERFRKWCLRSQTRTTELLQESGPMRTLAQLQFSGYSLVQIPRNCSHSSVEPRLYKLPKFCTYTGNKEPFKWVPILGPYFSNIRVKVQRESSCMVESSCTRDGPGRAWVSEAAAAEVRDRRLALEEEVAGSDCSE